jgi:hypothetical protein
MWNDTVENFSRQFFEVSFGPSLKGSPEVDRIQVIVQTFQPDIAVTFASRSKLDAMVHAT